MVETPSAFALLRILDEEMDKLQARVESRSNFCLVAHAVLLSGYLMALPSVMRFNQYVQLKNYYFASFFVVLFLMAAFGYGIARIQWQAARQATRQMVQLEVRRLNLLEDEPDLATALGVVVPASRPADEERQLEIEILRRGMALHQFHLPNMANLVWMICAILAIVLAVVNPLPDITNSVLFP